MLRQFFSSIALMFFASQSSASPWEIQQGSTLLDGTETATYIAGFMFLGEDYEFTSSQVNMRCIDEELVMNVVGDGDFITKSKAQENPTINFVFRIDTELVSFDATIENVDWGRERARVHNGPGLMDLLRQSDGRSAQVQLPVARTGVPEVRKLSLENVTKTTDLIVATCGPIETWTKAEPAAAAVDIESAVPLDETPMDLETAVSVGLAKKVVEELIRNQGISLEQILNALKPLTKERTE